MKWTPEEDAEVERQWCTGIGMRRIRISGRTSRAIQNRVVRLGLSEEDRPPEKRWRIALRPQAKHPRKPWEKLRISKFTWYARGHRMSPT